MASVDEIQTVPDCVSQELCRVWFADVARRLDAEVHVDEAKGVRYVGINFGKAKSCWIFIQVNASSTGIGIFGVRKNALGGVVRSIREDVRGLDIDAAKGVIYAVAVELPRSRNHH